MIVRERVDGDLDGCVDALAQVHECDGYPNTWPQNPHRWLSSPTVVKAWVGESDGRVVGHVAVDREVAGAPTTAGSIAVVAIVRSSPCARKRPQRCATRRCHGFRSRKSVGTGARRRRGRFAGDRAVRASRLGVRRREARRLDPDRRRPARGTAIPSAALSGLDYTSQIA